VRKISYSAQRRRSASVKATSDRRPNEIPTNDALSFAGDFISKYEEADLDDEDLRLIFETLDKAIAVIDDYDPRINPGSSMRQLRTLFASVRLRASVRRFHDQVLQNS
jgi:hypothetical protein